MKCEANKKCPHLGLYQKCNLSSSIYQCEHAKPDTMPGFNPETGRFETEFDLTTRIADALEKIARELEKQNKLKALSFRETYVELDEVDEIMEG